MCVYRYVMCGGNFIRSECKAVYDRLINQHVKGLYANLVAGRSYVLKTIDTKIYWRRHLIINVFWLSLWAVCFPGNVLWGTKPWCVSRNKEIDLYLLCKLYFKKYTVQMSFWFHFTSFEKTHGPRQVRPFYSLAHACKHESIIENTAKVKREKNSLKKSL